MSLSVKVLGKKAEKLEQKELLNHKVNPVQISALDEMLKNVYAIRSPKPSDYHARRDLVRVFNDMAKELFGNSNAPAVVEFGSFSMDIFDANSDLDLSVNFGNGAVEISREKKIQTLRKFARKFYALQSRGHVKGVNAITTAKVPIVKVVDCGTGVECDISVENRDGILKSQILNMVSSIDDRFRKLSFLMKAWAKAHDINSSKDKTLNSLSIVLLVAFHLQTRNPPILPPFSAILKDGSDPPSVMKLCSSFKNYGRSNKESLAELFISLLIKLSAVRNLWPKGLCASTYEACWGSKTWNSKVGCISVEDFTDRSQNVARAVGAYEVKTIYKCIQLSIQHLFAFMDRQIEGSRLMELLFGCNAAAPTLVGAGISDFGRNVVHARVPLESHQAKQLHVMRNLVERRTMPFNSLHTEGIPHMAGWRGIPSLSYGRTGQPIAPVSVLEKRKRPADSWGGAATGGRSVAPSVSWIRTREQSVGAESVSIERPHPAQSWRPVLAGGLAQTSAKLGTKATPFDLSRNPQQSADRWGGMHEHHSATQQPIAGAWIGREGTSAFGPNGAQAASSWRERQYDETNRSVNALLNPTPSSVPIAHLQNQVPASLNYQAVYPASSGPFPRQSLSEKNYWISTYQRR